MGQVEPYALYLLDQDLLSKVRSTVSVAVPRNLVKQKIPKFLVDGLTVIIVVPQVDDPIR